VAHHKSAKKRIKTSQIAKFRNHVVKKSIRTVTKKLHAIKDIQEAGKIADKLFSMLDRAEKKNVIHANNVGRHKSQISIFINRLKQSQPSITA